MTGSRFRRRAMVLRSLAIAAALALSGCRAADEGSAPESAVPGAAPRPAALAAQLREAARRMAPSLQARARHRDAAGAPRYVNRLALEPSPYLLQHAHNPVDWFPWGEEAFTRARTEGKPILLSVGYATCHWCHVMEAESFEDEEIAAFLNRRYVAIKVDREERPDIDETYLRAVILLTGGGGWPMTVWLTPDREVFFAGTYFPARDGDRGARMGFRTLLERLADDFAADPARAADAGREVAARLQALATVAPLNDLPAAGVLHAAYARYHATFDHEHGGFGGAPKFPMPSVLDFLLRYHRRTGESDALAMVERTLERMAAGGVRDQLGGGFHRYATDAAWRVPHFEKMLYDNAQLATVYLAAAQATGRSDFAAIVREVLDDMLRSFRSPDGAFHAAIDADDPRGEGVFYTWTPVEIADALDVTSSAAVRALFGVTDRGDLDGRTVLTVVRSRAEVGGMLGLDDGPLTSLLAEARATLLRVRATRPAPLIDTKILTGWNGLAIGAFARAGAVLREPRYLDAARDAARFVLERMSSDGRLLRVHAGGRAGQAGFLEDYAFLVSGLLDLAESTSELRWVSEAGRLQATLDAEFWDGANGGFFASGAERDAALPRTKPSEDGALPSGNAVAAENLVRLALLTDDDDQRRRAAACMRAFGRRFEAVPTSAPRGLGALEAQLDRAREIVIVEPTNGDPDGRARLLEAVYERFLPNRAVLATREGPELDAAAQAIAFVGEKQALDGRATAYVCERGRCQRPTTDPAVLAGQLAEVVALPGSVPKGD